MANKTEPPFLLLLAWRNIWRNKRRTLITMLSVFMAVLLSSLMTSIQQGAWDKMTDNVLSTYTGYLQIHKKGYWDKQSINESFIPDEQLLNQLHEQRAITAVLPRLESFAMASADRVSSGVLVLGIVPEIENENTQLASRLTQGQYFPEGRAGILLTDSLAAHLKLHTGDTLILLGQGFRSVSAAGKYEVTGILHFPSPDLNKKLVFLPLQSAQELFGAENRLTSLALFLQPGKDAEDIARQLESQIDTARYEVLAWPDMMPELVQAREVDTAGAMLMLSVLYIIIAFGIFGTLLMMMRERMYEMGVLIAIGMKRYLLGIMFWLEITFIGLLGALLGIAASFPVVYYFYKNPIDMTRIAKEAVAAYERFGFEPIFPASMNPQIFLQQAIVVFILTSIMALYPFWVIKKLTVIEAMKS